MSTSGRGGGRGGPRSGGRGSGRGSSRTGGGNNSNSNNNNNNNSNANATGNNNNRRGRSGRGRGNRQNQRGRGGKDPNNIGPNNSNNMDNVPQGLERDEDVLIAFMPYLKGSNPEASRIHEEYQIQNDQREFLRAARNFLIKEKRQPTQRDKNEITSRSTPPSSQHQNKPLMSSAEMRSNMELPSTVSAPSLGNMNNINKPDIFNFTSNSPLFSSQHENSGDIHLSQSHLESHTHNTDSGRNSPMQAIEAGLGALLHSDDDPIVIPSLLPTTSSAPGTNIWGSLTSPITPPRPNNSNDGSSQQRNHDPLHPTSPWGTPLSSHHQHFSTQKSHNSNISNLASRPELSTPTDNAILSEEISSDVRPEPEPLSPPGKEEQDETPTTPAPKREAPTPKRVWTHPEDQPGSIIVNGISGEDPSLILPFGPREELTAHWSLPVDYLVKRDKEVHREISNPSFKLEEALKGLTIGLFRRGCTENGSQASIIAKENASYDYWHDPVTNTIRGKVPFYSPRTPGNVLFRMYWEKEPVFTLGMGPTIRVRVLEHDFENSVRFILSNFKGRKSNPTSLSSLHSLAVVLETPLSRRYESAARATWGCIQEARKVIDACFQEYVKTSTKMAQLEEEVEELKKQVAEEEDPNEKGADNDDGSNNLTSSSEENKETAESAALGENATALQEKTRALMSGRASCERKWRDSQLAFASILKSVLTNPSMGTLLRRDLITKMRVEFELWCPLSEEFAISAGSGSGDGESETPTKTWYDSLNKMQNQSITTDDFRSCAQSRVKMQMRTLGFDVNSMALEDALFPRNRNNPNMNQPRTMDPGAVGVFNALSSSMGKYYQELHVDEDKIVRQREQIRLRTQNCVADCGAFPPGTEVVVFGSSANGFGSPQSDLDMCLQLPSGVKLDSDEDSTGAAAMAKLAEYFEKTGMQGVDTARLTARIPIIRYYCPNPLATGENTEDDLIECDLSMHNPLAVLNTSFLRSYSEITPVTRVLMSIIKRWAKARDINSPARHTLSSYGYTIMLLHFLTFHKRAGTGLVVPIVPPEGNPRARNQPTQNDAPLLPNLQWMDPMWPNYAKSTPYRELVNLPRHIIKHPLKDDSSVNTYFYRPNTPNEKTGLQMLFPGQDLSLAILLASFFRYYAYEFDYKRHVVSLHSTITRGLVEREVKAELDGWRNYSAALAIEDPFELDYDVAHVLRGGYYHRIRREFALAYTKIADAASGRQASWNNKGDLRKLSGSELLDWICEPVAIDRDLQQQTLP